MKIDYRKAGDATQPRRLFVLINQFNFAAFPVHPRYMGLAQARTARNRDRIHRLQRKGALP